MTNFLVRVSYEYPVQAVSPKDALSTVHQVIRLRYIGVSAEGLTEILDASTKKVVLTAKLNLEKR